MTFQPGELTGTFATILGGGDGTSVDLGNGLTLDAIYDNAGGDISLEVTKTVSVPAPLIGGGVPVFLAVGGILSGAKLLERGKKRRSLGTTRLRSSVIGSSTRSTVIGCVRYHYTPPRPNPHGGSGVATLCRRPRPRARRFNRARLRPRHAIIRRPPDADGIRLERCPCLQRAGYIVFWLRCRG